MDYGLPDGVRTLQEWYWLGSIELQNAGFQVVAEEPVRSFSRDDLVNETWELKL